MENLLLKLAQQLDSLDEASVMSLWGKYARLVCKFEPTKRWEYACLIFSFIQAKRMKNQLFNHFWAMQSEPHSIEDEPQPEDVFPKNFSLEEPEPPQPCRFISFNPSENKEK